MSHKSLKIENQHKHDHFGPKIFCEKTKRIEKNWNLVRLTTYRDRFTFGKIKPILSLQNTVINFFELDFLQIFR